MKKILLLTVAVVMLTMSLSAQMYHHAAGGSIVVALSGEAGSPMLNYNARLNIVEMSDDMSFSISATPGVFLSLSVNSRTGGEGGVGLDLPLTADLNFGAFSTYDYSTSVGAFVSGGAGLTMIAGDYGNIVAYGPLARAGVRANILDMYKLTLWSGIMYNVHKQDLEVIDSNPAIFGIGLLWHFGDY